MRKACEVDGEWTARIAGPQYPWAEIGPDVGHTREQRLPGSGYIEINSSVAVRPPIVTIYASPDGARP